MSTCQRPDVLFLSILQFIGRDLAIAEESARQKYRGRRSVLYKKYVHKNVIKLAGKYKVGG